MHSSSNIRCKIHWYGNKCVKWCVRTKLVIWLLVRVYLIHITKLFLWSQRTTKESIVNGCRFTWWYRYRWCKRSVEIGRAEVIADRMQLAFKVLREEFQYTFKMIPRDSREQMRLRKLLVRLSLIWCMNIKVARFCKRYNALTFNIDIITEENKTHI